MRVFVLLMLIGLFPAVAGAEALVLLQGYLGEDDPWRRSGVARELATAGWRDGGHLHVAPYGVRSTVPAMPAGRTFYTVVLSSEAPLMAQLRQLEPMMAYVRSRHAHESLLLAGHSAGGVLGRLYMVHHPDVAISALITFASPHLGTETAELGQAIGQSPLGWLAPLLGADTLNRSQGLYHDLGREHPSNLLFWLNRQPHPPARYISVVRRESGFPLANDLAVPAWSQDMNHVPVLQGRARVVFSDGGHNLNPGDGVLLVNLLRRLQRL